MTKIFLDKTNRIWYSDNMIFNDNFNNSRQRRQRMDTTKHQILVLVDTIYRECKDPNAIAYIKGLYQAELDYGMKGFKTQIIYIMCNIGHWRGEIARTTKAEMKRLIKDLK